MKILLGHRPNPALLVPLRPANLYGELWTALEATRPGEWCGLAAEEIKGRTLHDKKGTLWAAAKRRKLSIFVVVDNQTLFVALKDRHQKITYSADQPLPVPAAPKGKQAPAIPAPQAMTHQGRAPETVAVEMERMLLSLVESDDQEAETVDLGLDPTAYRMYEKELEAMAREQKIRIDYHREGNVLYCTYLGPANK
jgi:hypothetical protein